MLNGWGGCGVSAGGKAFNAQTEVLPVQLRNVAGVNRLRYRSRSVTGAAS
jgi:hypothetical protein